MIFKDINFSGKVQQKQNSPQIAPRAVYRIGKNYSVFPFNEYI